MSEWTELLERFRRGPEMVAAVMTGAAGAEIDWSPEGKWTIRQIMAHLADSEIMASERLRRTIAEENPTLLPFDQNAWAANLDYARRKPSESLDVFRRLRAVNCELLSGVPAAAAQRTATHSKLGVLTLGQLVEMFASHAEAHARQIRDLREGFKAGRAAKGTARGQ